MADLRYKIAKHIRKDSKVAKVIVWVLVAMFILSSLAYTTLAAGTNEQKYSLDEISRAAATIWSRDGSSHTDEDEVDTDTSIDILYMLGNNNDAHLAANFMGYAENHQVAVSSTANSITISYDSLQGKYPGAYGYAMYGHMLNMLGYDTIVQTGASQQDSSASAASRRLQGTLLLGSYLAHKSYTQFMRLSLETLQKLNVFRYLYQYATDVTEQDVVLNGTYAYTYTDYNGVEHTVYANDPNLAVRDESYDTTSGVAGTYVDVDGGTTNYAEDEQGRPIVTLSSDPDSPTLFQKAMKYIARLYSLIFNIGWTVVLPFLFIILGVVFMMYTRNVSKGRPSNTLWPHIKKIIIYILWLTLIIPVIATLYTAALDNMVADMEDSDSTQLADNIVLSTLVDFRTWSTVDGLNWNDIGRNYMIVGGDNIQMSTADVASGDLTPDSYFIIRDRAYNLNRALGYGGTGAHSVFGSNIDDYFTEVETSYSSTQFDVTGDPLTASLLGLNTDIRTKAQLSDESNALRLLLAFLTNETIDSASIASSQQAILNEYGDQDADALQQYWDAAISSDTYTGAGSAGGDDADASMSFTTTAPYGIGSNGTVLTNDNLSYDVFTSYNNNAATSSLPIYNGVDISSQGLIRHLIAGDVYFFPAAGAATDKKDTGTIAYQGFSALGLYNYLSTDFSSSDSITIYNNSEGRNITTNVNHYAVSAVGTGTLRWLYVLEACGFMLACAVIGIFYCLSMFLGTMKHSIQAMLALIKGVMSDVTSMVKAIALVFWMCIDILITVSMYKILTELLVSISSLIERTLLKLMMGSDFMNASNLTQATGGNLVMLLICIIRVIAFFAIIIFAVKWRKSFVKTLTEIFEVIVDRIVGAKTSVSNQGTPYADAAKRGLANVGTGLVIGAQNMTHGLTGAGGLSGFAGSAARLISGGAAAAAVGCAASNWLGGASQNVAESVSNSVMTNMGNNQAVIQGAAGATNNMTDALTMTDATSNDFGANWSTQQDFADEFANQISENIDSGVINSSNSLDENASLINDTTNDILNGGSQTSATESAINNTMNSTTQTGAGGSSSDTPVKGAAGNANQAINGSHRVETSTQIKGNNGQTSVSRKSGQNGQTSVQQSAQSGAKNTQNGLAKQSANGKMNAGNIPVRKTTGATSVQPAPAQKVQTPMTASRPNTGRTTVQPKPVTPTATRPQASKIVSVNNQPIINTQTVAKTNISRPMTSRPVNTPVNVPNNNIRTTVRPSVKPTIKPSANDPRVPHNKGRRRTG